MFWWFKNSKKCTKNFPGKTTKPAIKHCTVTQSTNKPNFVIIWGNLAIFQDVWLPNRIGHNEGATFYIADENTDIKKILLSKKIMLKHTKFILNDRVVCDRNTAAIDLCKATFVDQFTHTLQVWIPGVNINFMLNCRRNFIISLSNYE